MGISTYGSWLSGIVHGVIIIAGVRFCQNFSLKVLLTDR